MTAIEWFNQQLVDKQIGKGDSRDWNAIFEKAKEMEKQQIIDAHGNQTKKSGGVTNYTYILTGEKYYEQTFKQEP
jgi:hypothetical protein